MTTSAHAQSPRSLIVVPTLNEAAHVDDLLDLLASEAELVDGEIVVADGGSVDETVAIAARHASRNPRIRVMANPRRIQSAALNLAVEQWGAGTKYIIRIDAHGGYPRDYCRSLIRDAELTTADAVVVPMLTMGIGLFQRAVAVAQNSTVGNGGASHRSDKGARWVDHGHHALIRTDAFCAVGGYDESFRFNEDAELDYRLTNSGRRILLTPQTHLVYYPRATPLSLFRQYLGYGSGRARNVLKHGSVPKLRQVLPLAIAPTVGMSALTTLHWAAALPFLAWSALCVALGAIASTRRGQSFELPFGGAPLVGLAAMIMQLAWSLGFWAHCAGTLNRKRSSS